MPRVDVALDSIPMDTPHRVERGGSGIVVIRTEAGIRAYHDICPHASWRLSAGEIVDGFLECPGHGWQFDVTTGRCESVPAYCLKSVSATILGETVRLEWIEQEVIAVGSQLGHDEALV